MPPTLKSFYVATTPGIDLINVGHDIRSFIREAQMENGSITLAFRQPGAALVLLPTEGRRLAELKDGIKKELSEKFPASLRHLLNPSLTIPVERGKLLFDPWQEVYLLDYDESGRRREVVVQINPSIEATDKKQGAKGRT